MTEQEEHILTIIQDLIKFIKMQSPKNIDAFVSDPIWFLANIVQQPHIAKIARQLIAFLDEGSFTKAFAEAAMDNWNQADEAYYEADEKPNRNVKILHAMWDFITDYTYADAENDREVEEASDDDYDDDQ